jgi:hypothetical protein
MREIIPIPNRLTVGFNIRVAASTVHLGKKDRRLVGLNLGASHFYLAMKDGETLEDFNASVVSVMEKRGQGNQW